MKFAGLDAILLEGCASRPVYLYITGERVEILDASEFWGLDTQETQVHLKSKHERRLEVACIGQAGEKLVRYATITNGTRTAARCGVGTVMGSKNLKAVVILADGQPSLHNPGEFKKLVGQQVDILKKHPKRESLSQFGTTTMTRIVNSLGIYPVENFQEG